MWNDVFEEGPWTLLTDSAFTALQNTMRRSDNGPWRITGVRSTARFLWLTSQGRAVAESVKGVPRAVLETPYWTRWFKLHGAVVKDYILAYGETVVLFLERKAAAGKWEVSGYSLRESAKEAVECAPRHYGV